MEIMKLILSSIPAIASIIGLYIAYKGLNKWHAETIGKRKAELAEEVLADFYEAKDIINGARNPGGFNNEGNTRQKQDWESLDDTRILNSYYRTFERLHNKAEFFAKLQARKYRFVALFGIKSVSIYDQLFMIHEEIIGATKMLLLTHQRNSNREETDSIVRWKTAIGWGDPVSDPTLPKLDKIISEVENICRPAIQERYGNFLSLKFFY